MQGHVSPAPVIATRAFRLVMGVFKLMAGYADKVILFVAAGA